MTQTGIYTIVKDCITLEKKKRSPNSSCISGAVFQSALVMSLYTSPCGRSSKGYAEPFIMHTTSPIETSKSEHSSMMMDPSSSTACLNVSKCISSTLHSEENNSLETLAFSSSEVTVVLGLSLLTRKSYTKQPRVLSVATLLDVSYGFNAKLIHCVNTSFGMSLLNRASKLKYILVKGLV